MAAVRALSWFGLLLTGGIVWIFAIVVGPGTPVMSFVGDDLQVLAATFRQEVIQRIKPGDEAELGTFLGSVAQARCSGPWVVHCALPPRGPQSHAQPAFGRSF